MAWQIVSGNLNVLGNAGQFESDPSTWGFGSSVGFIFYRSLAYKQAGLYSQGCDIMTEFGGLSIAGGGRRVSLAQMNLPQMNKNYLIRAYIRTNNGDYADGRQIGTDAVEFYLNDNQPAFTDTIEDQVLTVADIKKAQGDSTFTKIEQIVQFTASPSSAFWDIGIRPAGGTIRWHGDGQGTNIPRMWIDAFEIYEVILVPEDCDLQIDVGNTVIVDATPPSGNNGSITVAITGGDPPFEYSKNDGASWQDSNQFTALGGPVVYPIRVREKNNIACVDAQSFVVNMGGAPFDWQAAITHETVLGANNGRVVISIIGGSAPPYQYSKDGGNNYQLSNDFQGLAPGTYPFVVKDNNNYTVAKNITINAGPFSFERTNFSKNPIEYQVGAIDGYEAMENYRIYNEVRVEDVQGSGIFNTKMKMELEPVNGLGKFSLRQAFRGVLTAVPPAYGVNTIVRLTDRLKAYKNYSGHLQDDEVTPAELTASNVYQVLLGGIDKLRHPTIDYLLSYLPTYKKFLTWAPLEKEVTRLQEDYLNFYVYGLSVNTLNLQCKAYFDDDTNQAATVKTINGVAYGQLYQLPAGPQNCGVLAINPAKTVVKYELWLIDQLSNVISEVRTYKVNTVVHPLTRYFMFLNSLGAYEVHQFKGQADITAQYQRDIIRKHLPNTYTASQGEFESNNATLRDEGSYSTGFFKGRYAAAWQEYMKDLVLSSRVYLLQGNTRKPVTITTSSYGWKSDQNYQHFLRFTAVDAYEDDSFTPAAV